MDEHGNNELNNINDDTNIYESKNELNNNYNTNSNYGNEAQVQDVSYSEVKKTKRKKGKIFGAIAALLVTAILGGVAGGGITYLVLKSNSKTQDIVFAPPSFSKDEEALSISDAFQKVSPAVVTVSTKGLLSNGFFQQQVEGIGSGFIINEDGYILTNYHVVKGSTEVTVILSDKTEVKAKVINYDEAQDVAMLKMQDGTKVPAVAELGDSSALYQGQEVIAVGTPMSKDFSQTVTNGIVSAVNRNVTTESGAKLNVIQTNTAINPGNSGGPLVNTKGQVIGINTMKLAGDAEGIGFAIPINDIKGRIEGLSKPVVNLGIKVKEINDELSKQTGLPLGVYVAEVVDFSSAQKGGIKPGDVIVEFDGKKIKTYDDLKLAKEGKEVGNTVNIKVIRNDKEVSLDVALTE